MSSLCIKRGILRLWVSYWLRFRIYRTKWIPCQTRENSTILKQRTHVPSQPSTIPSPRDQALPRFWIAARYTEIMGTSGNVFERLPAWEGQASTIFDNSKIWHSFLRNWDLILGGNTKRPESEMWREPQNSSIPVPRFQSGGGLWNHTCGTSSHSGMIDNPRFQVSELHPDSMEFQSWKVQLQNWSRSSSHNAMHQRIWDSKIHWRSYDIAIEHRAKRFHRLGYAWCDDCVCIEKTSRQTRSLPKKSKCRRAACSKKYDRFSRGWYIAYMVKEHFRATGAYEAVQGLGFVQNKFAEWRRPRLRR